MVFGVQKGGFYIAKVWFLQCESRRSVYVVVPWRVTSVRVSTIFWYLHIRKQPQNGNPSAAVGADLSCPHIRKHPRNGERKRTFDNVKMRIC